MTIRKFSEASFSRSGLRRGAMAALPFVISNGVAGIVIGIAYRGSGLSFGLAVSFSLLVYSGTAQAVTLGMWAIPPPVAAMVTACIATNARYLVMGAHLRHMFAGLPRRLMLPILFLLADASWMMTTADAAEHRPDAGYLLGSSIPMAVGWMGGTALGYALPLTVDGPFAADAAFLPLAFIVALLPTQWRGRQSLLPWSAAAISALLATGVIGESWAILAGGAVGTAISAARGDDA